MNKLKNLVKNFPDFWSQVRNKLFILMGILVITTIAGIFCSWVEHDWFENLVIPVLIEPLVIILFLSIYAKKGLLFNDEVDRFQLTDSELLEKYNGEEALYYEGSPFPATALILPKERISLADIECSLTPEFYYAPPLIEQHKEKILASNKGVWNSLTLRLSNFTKDGSKVRLDFHFSDYFTYSATNNSPDLTIAEQSIRDILEPGPYLYPLASARAENHLGISCLLFTKDNYLVAPKRNERVVVFKNKLAPSISGAFNYDIAFDPRTRSISLERALSQELTQELSKQIEIKDIYLLGLTREFRRLGKPEIFFCAQTSLTKDEVQSAVDANPISKEESSSIYYFHQSEVSQLINDPQSSAPLRDALILYTKSI